MWRNFWIDAVLFVQLLGLVVTGAVLKWGFGPRGGGHGWRGGGGGVGARTLLGLSHHGWGEVHFWLSVTLVVVVVLHLVVHWHWIACRFRDLGKSRGSAACADEEEPEPIQ